MLAPRTAAMVMGPVTATRLMAMVMGPVTATRLICMAIVPALSAAVSMPPLGVVGAKAD